MTAKAELIQKLSGVPVEPVAPAPEVTPPPTPIEGGEPNKQPSSELDSTRFAAIAKREAKLVASQEEFKKREEALAAKEKELQTKMTPFQEFEELLSKDKIQALKSLGFTQEDIVNWLAETGEKKELTPEEKMAAAAQAEIEKFKKSEEEKASKLKQEQDAATIKRYKDAITGEREKNKESLEWCEFYGDVADAQAYMLAEQMIRDGHEPPSPVEALKIVEEFYDDMHKEAMGKIKKLKPTPSAPETETPKTPEPIPQAPPKTITNRATATVASTANRHETRSEKRARLENALRMGVKP